MKLLLLFLLGASSLLVADEALRVRGFLYQGAQGHWVLADQPNLRSCCLEKSEGMGTRLPVEGAFQAPSPSRAVTLSGKMVNGILTEASLIPDEGDGRCLWCYATLILLAVVCGYIYKRGLRRDR